MSNSRGCVVAAGHALTVATAEDVLRAGGNAYDAAIAALATSFVTEPVLSSPGGGGFLLAAPAEGPPRVYDFFVQTPLERRSLEDIEFYPVVADFGTEQQQFRIGRGTIATPGVLRGIEEIHADLGTIPLRELVAPACRLALDGVVVTEMQGYLHGVVEAIVTASEPCRSIFAGIEAPDTLARAGARTANPELADALEAIAVEGADLFYRGEIAASIVADMKAGGQLGTADLAGYRVEKRRPLSLDYRGARILTNPPPSSGGTLIGFGLDLLRDCDVAADPFGSPAHLCRLAAVMEATAAARVEHSIEALASLDPTLTRRWREQVAWRTRACRGTTHVSVIDRDGNVAAASVSNGEGSSYVVPGTGIILNNMLGEDDLNPDGLHQWAPGVRMTSMMAPTAIGWRDGRRVATGSGGSNRIRTALLQVLVNLVDFGMDIEEAVAAPRIHVEDTFLSVEGGFDAERIDAVLRLWPESKVWDARNMFFGGAHTVATGERGVEGIGDPRRDGACAIIA